jgi:hypothetical protein
MSIASRLAMLALAVVAGLALYQWQLTTRQSRDATEAALRQFDNSDAAAQQLRTVGATQHWWLLGGLATLVVLWSLLFWDDIERLWRRFDRPGDRQQQSAS